MSAPYAYGPTTQIQMNQQIQATPPPISLPKKPWYQIWGGITRRHKSHRKHKTLRHRTSRRSRSRKQRKN